MDNTTPFSIFEMARFFRPSYASHRVFLLIFAFCMAAAGKLGGQVRQPVQRDGGMFDQGRSERGDMRSQGDFDETLDTFGVFPFWASNPAKFERLRDTTLDAWLHQYDPTRQRLFDYLHRAVGSLTRGTPKSPRTRPALVLWFGNWTVKGSDHLRRDWSRKR